MVYRRCAIGSQAVDRQILWVVRFSVVRLVSRSSDCVKSSDCGSSGYVGYVIEACVHSEKRFENTFNAALVDRRAHEISLLIFRNEVKLISRALGTIARISLSRASCCGPTLATRCGRLYSSFATATWRLCGDRRYPSCILSATRGPLPTGRHIRVPKTKHRLNFACPVGLTIAAAGSISTCPGDACAKK